MGKILKLAANFIGPFKPVQQIVSKAVDDNQQHHRNVSNIRSLARQNAFHKLRPVGAPEMQMIKVTGKIPAVIITVPEIAECRLKCLCR